MSSTAATGIDATSGGVARGEDLESQRQQEKGMSALDVKETPLAAEPIDVKQSEKMFQDMESRLASESGNG